MKILVLGGTAWVGHEVAEQLVRAGHDVTCAARGSALPAGAHLENIDRDEDDALHRLTGQHWDAVVDVARQPGHVRRAVRDLEPVADRYLFVSTANVYSAHSEIGADEDSPLLDPLVADFSTDPEDYGPGKVACEEAILSTFGPDRSLIARAGLIAGPGDRTQRSTYWPWRFAHPSTPGMVLVPDAPELPAALIDVRDIAAWLRHCTETGGSGVYNAMGDPVPLPEHLAVARAAAGSDADPVAAPASWLRSHDVGEWAGPRSLPLWLADREWYGFGARSNARAKAAGLRLRPLVDTLRDGLAWRNAQAPSDITAGLTDEDERRLLEELSAPS